MSLTTITTAFKSLTNLSRTIITRVPETSTELYNSFSMYPPVRQYFGHEVGMFVKLTPNSKPLSQRYFNKPIIHYKIPPPANNLIKYKPYPHNLKNLPLSMRGYTPPN